jgi:hypothetical protein
MNDILQGVCIGIFAEVIYEITKYLLRNRITNNKVLIPVSMVLAIIIGTLIIVLINLIF